MNKKALPCNEYAILLKQAGESTSVFVNGELFATIGKLLIEDIEINNVIKFVRDEYEKWGFKAPHSLNYSEFIKQEIRGSLFYKS